MILDGNITAMASMYGSGIGAGTRRSGEPSTIVNLSIFGGKITANGTDVAIGSGGFDSEVQNLLFSGTAALICTATTSQFAVNALSIVLSHASLVFATQNNQLFGVNPSSQGPLKLAILYGSVKSEGSERLSGLNGTFLQIGHMKINFDPNQDSGSALDAFCISSAVPFHEQCFPIQSFPLKSVIVSVPWYGHYSIRTMLNQQSAFLQTFDGQSVLQVFSDYTFIEGAQFRFPVASSTQTFTVKLQAFLNVRKVFLGSRLFLFAMVSPEWW
jgi:hypothetical protein